MTAFPVRSHHFSYYYDSLIYFLKKTQQYLQCLMLKVCMMSHFLAQKQTLKSLFDNTTMVDLKRQNIVF